MELGLISVLLDSAFQAAVMIGEHSRNKKTREANTLLGVLQQVDAEAVASAVSPLKLAGFMRGAVTAELVQPVINAPAFRGLMKELFLAKIADCGEDKVALVGQSMTALLSTQLGFAAAQEDVKHFCANVVAAIDAACAALIAEVRFSSPATLIALQQVSLLKRVTSVLDNIERHAERIAQESNEESLRVREEWLATYKVICAQDHGYIVPPDFETNKKIPMSDLYVVPTVSRGGLREYRDGSEVDFAAFRSAIDRTVLLGDPGGGKSTLSNFLAAYWCGSDDGLVPFHVTLREFAKQPSDQSVVQYIEQQLSAHYQHDALPGLVASLLLSGQAVVIFDGLDELIDTTKRRAISSTVELFGTIYPLARILVTSRRVGYDQARLDPDIFQTAVIAEFRDSDVSAYVHKWFASQDEYGEEAAERLAKSFIAQSESVQDLRSNPLMLALMCIIFRGENSIPRNRPAVYEKCATLLFEKWDGHRDIEVPLQARAHVDAAMKHVAHWMLLSGSGDAGVRYDDLVRQMATYLHGRAFETEEVSKKAAQEFVDFCKGRAWVFSDAGTTAEGDVLFTFTHRTFMEYFAAYHLTRINDTPEKLARTLLPKIAQEEWDVVAQLAIQIEEGSVDQGSERALRVMLSETRKRTVEGRSNVLAFVARCAAFSTISPALVRELVTACIEQITAHMDSPVGPDVNAALNPWLNLLRSTPDSQRHTVIDVHTSVLGTAISSTDPTIRNPSCYLFFLGVSLSWPGAFFRNTPWGEWWPMYKAITSRYAAELTAFCVDEPTYQVGLVVSGAQSVSDAVESMRARGYNFAETFFGTRNNETSFLPVPTLALVASRFATNEHAIDAEMASIASEAADVFLTEFHAAHARGGDPVQGTRHPLLFGFGLEPNWRLNAAASVNLVEASLIIGLGQFELMWHVLGELGAFQMSEVFRDLRSARADASELDETSLLALNVSEAGMDFARQWAKGSTYFFETSPMRESEDVTLVTVGRLETPPPALVS